MAPQARTDDPTAKPHAAIATALVLLPLGTPATPAVAANRPTVQPLPAHLEAIRAAEATTLYGAPGIRPLEQRRSSLVTMVTARSPARASGNYVPGTHQPGNW